MSYAMLAQLLMQFGPSAFELAKKLVEKWSSTEPVTIADIDELKKLGQRSPKDAMLEALIRANVPLDSEQGKAMLALVP